MKLQVIEDSNGKPTGVFIPIKEWNQLKKQNKSLVKMENKVSSKEQILHELKEAVTELMLIEKGKIKARPIKQLLDEL